MHPSLEKLIQKLKYISQFNNVLSILHWDEQVNLPSHSIEGRSEQIKALTEVAHRELTDPSIGKLLEELNAIGEKNFDLPEWTIVRETLRDYSRATRLPTKFVAEKKAAESQGYHAWLKARESNDFSLFIPTLEKLLELSKEEAHLVNPAIKPYDYHLDLYDQGLNTTTVEQLFTELKKDLLPLVQTIIASPNKLDVSVLKNFPIHAQKSFALLVAEKIGFDFSYGRIDVSVHPFCGGHSGDARITTRFNENVPLDSLFSVIHEVGHALYELGFEPKNFGTPLAQAVGMAIHESQSRLWENQVGRSRAFWKFFDPLYRQHFSEALRNINSDTLYRLINAVELNPIRVDSDEVTYNLHIILRFELEKELFEGTLEVKNLREAWNEKSKKILQLTPKSDKEGILQDVHWSGAAFGYFPSYTIGNMIAAQLWESVKKTIPSLESEFEKGDFTPLLHWLRQSIHQFGKQYRTQELVQKVTNKPISPQPLIHYLKERYLLR